MQTIPKYCFFLTRSLVLLSKSRWQYRIPLDGLCWSKLSPGSFGWDPNKHRTHKSSNSLKGRGFFRKDRFACCLRQQVEKNSRGSLANTKPTLRDANTSRRIFPKRCSYNSSGIRGN